MSVLLQITLFLGTAVLIVPLAKYLRLPAVLSYFLAGLVAHCYITLPQDFLNLSIILLMLMMGFNFERPKQWQVGTIFTLVSSLVLTAITWSVFGQYLVSSMIIGFSLALSSHFLSSHQQHNILNTQMIIVVLLLTILPVLADEQSIQHGVANLSVTVACLSGLLLINQILIKTSHYLIVSAFIVGLALTIVQVFNIHPAIGALFAGITLANSPFKHQLTACFMPFKEVAIGLFFMMIGINTHLNTVIEYPIAILTGTLTLIACKALIMFGLSYRKQGQLISVALAQAGELSLIVIISTSNQQLIDTPEPLIWVTLCSMACTPLLYRLVQKYMPQPSTQTSTYDVTIIGFGNFGTLVGCIAQSQNIEFCVVDKKPAQPHIHWHQADATQYQQLQNVNLEQTKTVVIALSDLEDALNVARYLTLNYPHIQILTRSHSAYEAQLFKDLGIQYVYQEVETSAVQLSRQLIDLHKPAL
ncbi:cation:proton antiporter domain-containing protein [Acinetobacter sp. HY1485]|uniref:cation:proton antiporter domain-containing protein n=1 Tax=Acinetobacter sp. HY1485 TaxID=2970918 RepID=UPI0022B9A4E7|nr:cation:proton antiporter [Acinetobacter sp. HY1485]